MARGLRIVGIVLLTLIVLAFSAWAALALWHRLPGPQWLRGGAAAALAAAGMAASGLMFTRWRGAAAAAFATLAAAILIWWSTIIPPAAADFAPDVARQVRGGVEGDILRLSDVRNFTWRSETDIDPRWEERSYDLAGLRSLDLVLSHWDDSGIAHMIMSFGFADGRFLAWSVEVRRLRNGDFSPLADLFKENPLVVVAAEERDVIGVRTNVRKEDVYLYRLNLYPRTIRTILLEFVAQANALAARPAFYNTLTTNCTTSVVAMMRAVDARVPLDWRLLMNGRLPEYAFSHGALEEGLTLEQAKARAPVTARAQAAGLGEDFSRAIRQR